MDGLDSARSSTSVSGSVNRPAESLQKRLLVLQARFKEIFGTTFEARVRNEEAAQEWMAEFSKEISNLTDAQIVRGLETLRTRARTAMRDGVDFWPPNAFQFSALCDQPAKPQAHVPLLAAPRDTKDRGAELAKIAEICKAGGNQAPQWRETFFHRPGSQLACDVVMNESKQPGRQRQRWIDHRDAAIAGGYMDAAGIWSGKR